MLCKFPFTSGTSSWTIFQVPSSLMNCELVWGLVCGTGTVKLTRKRLTDVEPIDGCDFYCVFRNANCMDAVRLYCRATLILQCYLHVTTRCAVTQRLFCNVICTRPPVVLSHNAYFAMLFARYHIYDLRLVSGTQWRETLRRRNWDEQQQQQQQQQQNPNEKTNKQK